MVKALLVALLLFAALARAAPPITKKQPPQLEGDEDSAARSERSANLSHVTGTARKIKMFIKNRHLQLLPGGTVNGTTDDTSPYTILQRTTVGIGQMKIQGVATCQYLCMDECGLLYGSIEFSEECIFNETIEATNYNKYSSSKYSNERRTFFLALNRRGQSRKVMIKAKQQLGKLSSYTRVLTRSVSPEELQLRHHHQCPIQNNNNNHHHHHHHIQLTTDPPRCRKKKKRKKKKRKFNNNDEHELLITNKKFNISGSINSSSTNNNNNNSDDAFDQIINIDRIKCDNNNNNKNSTVLLEASNVTNVDLIINNFNNKNNTECQRDFIVTVKPKLTNTVNKSVMKPLGADKKSKNMKKKKKNLNINNNNNNNKQRKRLDQVDVLQENATTTRITTTTRTTTMTPATTTTTTTTNDELFNEEDYLIESSTHLEWEEPTDMPDITKNSAEIDNVQSNSD